MNANASPVSAFSGERTPGPDRDGLLAAIADRLRMIRETPAARDDAVVEDIFMDMLYARDMAELAADIDRLCDRLAHLLAHPEDTQPILAPDPEAQNPAARRVRLRL